MSEKEADRVFAALAHSTRRDIVRHAMRGDESVSALARRYTTSFAAIQRHVALLEAAGLVSKTPSGREQLVRARVDTIDRARDLLGGMEALWRGRAQRFEQVLGENEEGERG